MLVMALPHKCKIKPRLLEKQRNSLKQGRLLELLLMQRDCSATHHSLTFFVLLFLHLTTYPQNAWDGSV